MEAEALVEPKMTLTGRRSIMAFGPGKEEKGAKKVKRGIAYG
jgi:hypothetical protein